MKVHIILNSHLDPAWLWNKEQGMDEVVATARTACDLLDDYPEIFITRGEAWFYEVLEFCAPDIYERVKKHVASGRWQVVGNWYIQPDCNQPSPESFAMQAEVSRDIFARLGARPTVGYNVDSFGHAATLPDFYRACGVDSYIMMRPSTREMPLPGHLFLWESPGGSRITVARLKRYQTTGAPENLPDTIDVALTTATPGIDHCLCFVGVGDHGGGPTRREIEYYLAHRKWAPGVELVFSHPRAYFDAALAEAAEKGIELPVVREELQQHAIGCYTSMHHIKQLHRRGEETLKQARRLAERCPKSLPPGAEEELADCAKTLLFNEFHDLMGGCSIKSAMDNTISELGGVWTSARNLAATILRREAHRTLKPDPEQRAVFCNVSGKDFNGFVEFEPWLGYRKDRRPTVEIIDENGRTLEYQQLFGEAGDVRVNRYTLPLAIPADGRRELRIRRLPDAPAPGIEQPDTLPIQLFKRAVEALNIRLDIIRDNSDTWSHGMSRYEMEPEYSFVPGDGVFQVLSVGPFFYMGLQKWRCPAGDFEMEIRLYRNDPTLRFRVHAVWNGRQQMAKLRIAPPFELGSVRAGCPGGTIDRAADGRELPLYNFVTLAGEKRSLTAVSRDIYGYDIRHDGTLRLTLLRSAYYAHKDPFAVPENSVYPICDRGEHDFEFTLLFDATPEEVDDEAARQEKPIYFLESTLGCARKYFELE